MDPLGTFKRSLFLGAAFAVFIVVLPLLLLYVSGYRLSYKNKAIVETGGVYVHTEGIDGIVTVTAPTLEKPIENSGGLVQGLDPSIYTVTLKRDGFNTWQKRVQVFASKVNDVHPFQVATDPEILEIPETITNTAGKKISNSEFKTIQKLFLDKNVQREVGAVTLTKVNAQLIALWEGSQGNPPHFFCYTPNICSNAIVISGELTDTSTWDFFPKRNDIVIFTKKDGVYITEIDPFGGKNEVLLMVGTNPSIRLDGSILYIQNNKKISSIDLLP